MMTELVRHPRLSATLLILILVAVLLGDTMAFNQLATQSATDAIIPLLVVSVGVALGLEALRRVICRRRTIDLWIALACSIASALGWFAWAVPWPLAASAWIVLAAAVLGGSATNVASLAPSGPRSGDDAVGGSIDRDGVDDRVSDGDDAEDGSRSTLDVVGVVAMLGLVQTIVLTYFAVLAFVDAPTGPFG